MDILFFTTSALKYKICLMKKKIRVEFAVNSEHECRNSLKLLIFQQGTFPRERIMYWPLHEKEQGQNDAPGRMPFAEFVPWPCHWLFPHAQMHGFPGRERHLLFFGLPWHSLFCTGCVYNRHLATCFLPLVFQPSLCASHTDFDFYLWGLPIPFAGF